MSDPKTYNDYRNLYSLGKYVKVPGSTPGYGIPYFLIKT